MHNEYRAEVEQEINGEKLIFCLDFDALQKLESELPENNLVLYVATKALPSFKEALTILSLSCDEDTMKKTKKALHPQKLWQLALKVLKQAMSDPDELKKEEEARKKREEEEKKGKKDGAPATS